MRIIVRAPIGSVGGYLRDGVGLIHALMKRGHVVDIAPLSVGTPVPKDIAQLFTFPISGHYDLEIHHAPPTASECYSFHKNRSNKVVMWTMWEWDELPESEQDFWKAKECMSSYDAVVGYTQQSLDAFAGAGLLGEDQETHVVQGGFEIGDWMPVYEANEAFQAEYPYRKNVRNDAVRFAMVGFLGARKNPYVALSAFNELKAEMGDDFNAELIFKTGFPLLPPNYDAPGVKFIQENAWSDDVLRAFYWSVDCVINFAWGEGKDLPLMEATMCGTPILANDTPGHRGWIHPGIQPLVPSVPMKMDMNYTGRYTGKAEIKEAMLDFYNNRVQRFTQAKQLASYIEKRATWDHRIVKFGEAIGVPL